MYKSGSASTLRKILFDKLQELIEHRQGIQLPKTFNFADFETIKNISLYGLIERTILMNI